jgi:hypothetical protein
VNENVNRQYRQIQACAVVVDRVVIKDLQPDDNGAELRRSRVLHNGRLPIVPWQTFERALGGDRDARNRVRKPTGQQPIRGLCDDDATIGIRPLPQKATARYRHRGQERPKNDQAGEHLNQRRSAGWCPTNGTPSARPCPR